MASNNDDKDIEIIPPDRAGRNRDSRWTYISFEDPAEAFRKLPLHKRILLGATWLAGIAVFALIVFLVVASAVLIWIPLLLAIGVITAIILFFRAKFRRR